MHYVNDLKSRAKLQLQTYCSLKNSTKFNPKQKGVDKTKATKVQQVRMPRKAPKLIHCNYEGLQEKIHANTIPSHSIKDNCSSSGTGETWTAGVLSPFSRSHLSCTEVKSLSTWIPWGNSKFCRWLEITAESSRKLAEESKLEFISWNKSNFWVTSAAVSRDLCTLEETLVRAEKDLHILLFWTNLQAKSVGILRRD